jgi:hypothetical protein
MPDADRSGAGQAVADAIAMLARPESAHIPEPCWPSEDGAVYPHQAERLTRTSTPRARGAVATGVENVATSPARGKREVSLSARRDGAGAGGRPCGDRRGGRRRGPRRLLAASCRATGAARRERSASARWPTPAASRRGAAAALAAVGVKHGHGRPRRGPEPAAWPARPGP